MAQVTVGIGGRSYRLACNAGEEAHLESLALTLDRKIAEMRQSFGEIGDQRLAIMAALTIADDAHEVRRRVQEESQRAEAAEEEARLARQSSEATERSMLAALTEMTAQIDRLTQALGNGTAT